MTIFKPHRRAALACGLLMAAIVPAAARPAHAQTQTDAISREVSVYNDLSSTMQTDAVSREVSLYNNLSTPIDMQTDAVSREVSLYNNLSPPLDMPTDAVSREVSLYNNLQSTSPTDAISREVSVEAVIHCTGDFDGDFAVTTADITAFVNVLTGVDTHPARRDAADINCDGVPNAKDIQPFVDAILGL